MGDAWPSIMRSMVGVRAEKRSVEYHWPSCYVDAGSLSNRRRREGKARGRARPRSPRIRSVEPPRLGGRGQAGARTCGHGNAGIGAAVSCCRRRAVAAPVERRDQGTAGQARCGRFCRRTDRWRRRAADAGSTSALRPVAQPCHAAGAAGDAASVALGNPGHAVAPGSRQGHNAAADSSLTSRELRGRGRCVQSSSRCLD